MQSDTIIYVVVIGLVIVFILWTLDGSVKKEAFTPDDSIPSFDAYQLMQQPSDPRYVYVPEIGGYLLPFDELDFGLAYHRWMYYYFPMYYEQYYDIAWPFDYEWPYDLYYGGNYGGDYGGDFYGYRGDYFYQRHPNANPKRYTKRVKPARYIPDERNMPRINTMTYPTRRTGFSGGQFSQRFSGTGSRGSGLRHGYNVPSFGGRTANIKEKFSSLENNYDVIGCGENLINSEILNRGGNNIEFTPGCGNQNKTIRENFGETEVVNGVFTTRDDQVNMKPVYGTLTWQNNDQTANGYPPYPTYPASEVYPNNEVQTQTTYRIPSEQGYFGAAIIPADLKPANNGNINQNGVIQNNMNQNGYPRNSITQDGYSGVPTADKPFYGDPDYSPEEQNYLLYPTLNKGYLPDQTNWEHEENLPDDVRQLKLQQCEQNNDKEFCRQRYGYPKMTFTAPDIRISDDVRKCVVDIYEQEYDDVQRNIVTPYDKVGFDFIQGACIDLHSGEKPLCVKQCNNIVDFIRRTSTDEDLILRTKKMLNFCAFDCAENNMVDGNCGASCDGIYADKGDKGGLFEFVNQGKCFESCRQMFPNQEEECRKNCNDIPGYAEIARSLYRPYCRDACVGDIEKIA